MFFSRKDVGTLATGTPQDHRLLLVTLLGLIPLIMHFSETPGSKIQVNFKTPTLPKNKHHSAKVNPPKKKTK